jgi:DNA-binding CsgD family transcriptional regulator
MSVQAGDPRTGGPIQLMAAGFADAVDLGGILDEVDRLQGRGVLQLLDLLVVRKNDDGSVTRISVEDDDLGDLFATVTTLEPDRLFGLLEGAAAAEARELAEPLPPGAALAFLLIEHRWARPLVSSIAEAGGVLLGEGFVDSASQSLLEEQIAAFDQAAQVISAAHQLEAEAVAEAMAVADAAGEAVAEADAIRVAATTDAVSALIAAGLIEEAAAEEAFEAVVAAADAEHRAAEAQTAASVTPAELRVLRYLPTKMTFAAIADKLGISRAAARKRAQRAYKVLGVHNRADAVVRARELGLIPKTYR